jgi:rubrerythrin
VFRIIWPNSLVESDREKHLLKENDMDILECTIKMKVERRNHYNELAEFAKDKDLKRLASLLAEANTELIKQLDILKASPEAISLTDAELSEDVCVFSPRFDAQHPEVSLKRDSDAYLHVVKEIQDAIELFKQLGAQTGTSQMKTIYRKLAEIESGHLSVVENIYSFVEDPRTYLEWGEFSNLKSL